MKLTLSIGILIFILIVILFLEIHRELHTFQVSRYTVRSRKFSALKQDIQLIFLSDLHNHIYGKKNQDLLNAIRQEQPDLILIGGDMLVGKETIPYDIALDFVSHLAEIAPVLYANGNHEQRMKENPEDYNYSYNEYKQELEKKGIHFLENSSCSDKWTKNAGNTALKLKFTGLELPLESYKKCKKYPVSVSLIEKCLDSQVENGYKNSKVQDNVASSYRILLAHNPAYVDAYKKWGADLILCGHLHGGIIRVPGFGCVITPQFFLFPKYSGEITREKDQTIVVSRGLGTHTVNLRLFNTAEVISLKLEKGAHYGNSRKTESI